MATRARFAWVAALLAALAAAIGTVGCETESASGRVITLSPSYARLEKGNSLTLTATGGWDYRWSLADGSKGFLDRTKGSQVIYTATQEGITQTVTVRGMFSSDNSSYAESHATIVQGDEDYAATATAPSTTTIASGGSSGGGSSGGGSSGGGSSSVGPSSGSIAISPSERQTISVGESLSFRASGGSNYQWSLSNESAGTLSSREGDSVTYQAAKPSTTEQGITQKLTVTGTVNGNTKSASVDIAHLY